MTRAARGRRLPYTGPTQRTAHTTTTTSIHMVPKTVGRIYPAAPTPPRLPPAGNLPVHCAAALGPVSHVGPHRLVRAARLRLNTHAYPTKLHTWPAP